ncbi:trypsin-like peptidase domain-containing protein [Nostocaceae cyanobacterium CENA357]|uniref:Trypsin-like peptidase domain-containing protein n=1 Tax=Atlanticothrix silvestris CENA357 TaxID=1725252 RepID=A0A8J7L731_9CYAN|nr:trypsin-like peptidase domain-containing protein [Atlanticothrix silvestris]MBH8556352.1 trypsin-like peptidase domain-containing protein [Atlanticothrix silvestris CENA357]
MSVPLELSVVRIYANSGRVIGAGFLVSQKYILTCAHVIADALGLSRTTTQMPDAEITLDFPLVAAKQLLKAQVVFWLPVNAEMEVEDIAGLELKHSFLNKAPLAPLITSDDWAGHPLRVLGFPAGQPDGVWATGVLRGRTAKGWVQLEDVKQPGYRLEPGFSGAPIWDSELQGIAGIAVAVDINRPEAKVGFMIPTQVLVSAWSVLHEQVIASCPYRGLFPFREEDTKFFFGRDIVTHQLVDTVHTQSLVAVIGASGSGKSSVVFAGLIPNLRQQGNWLIESFRPKTHPVDELAAVIVRLREPEKGKTQQDIDAGDLARGLRSQQVAAHTVLSRILSENENKRLLLVVDQFEELYASCSDVKERQLFLNQLLEAAELLQDFTLLLTLRADFLGYALSDRRFADALQNADLKLAPMNPKELQQAIAQPTNKQGVRLEEGLAERILQAVADSPGNLPLLEFTLTQLWAEQQNRQMTHAAYEAIGGVEKSLANHAEAEFAKLKPESQQQAQQIFVQLVRPGEGTEDTRRIATRNEVGDGNWDLVKRLADARLVVTGLDETVGKETVEIVHETLIREWGRLHGWMESDRSFRTWQELLRSRMRQWENTGKDEGPLLRGVPLGQAENWLKQRRDELSQAEQDFIQQSLALRDRDRKQKERRRKLTLLGLTSGLVIVSILAMGAFWLRWIDEVEASGVTALRNFESGTGEIEALVSAMEAGQEVKKMAFWNSQCLQDCPATSPLLALQKILDNIHQTNQINTYQRGINSIRFIKKEQQDEELIVAGGEDGTVTWRDFQTKPLKTLKNSKLHNNSIKSVDFSQDQKILATGASNGWVKLWDVSQMWDFLLADQNWSPPSITSIRHQCDIKEYDLAQKDAKCSVNNVRFLPSQQLLATTGDDGYVRLWTFKGKLFQTIPAHKGSIKSLNPNPYNNQQLATAGEDGLAKLWDINKTEAIATFKGHQCNVKDTNKCSVNSVWFHPKQKQLATAGDDGYVRLWDFSGKELTEKKIEADPEGVEAVRISNDDLIATAGKDGKVRLWNNFNRTLQAELKGHQGSVVSIRFNKQGDTLATAGKDDGTVRFWAVPEKSLIKPKNPLIQLKGHEKAVGSVRFSPDGKLLITASDDDIIRLWDLKGKLIRQFKANQGGVNSVRFSPKETKNLIVTGGKDGTIKLWTRTGESLKPLKPFEGHSQAVRSINFDSKGDRLVTAGDDGMAKLWDLEGTKLQEFPHTSKIETTRFSPDGKLLATVGENGTALLWNIISGKLSKQLTGHKGYVNTVGFSPTENKLATAGDDATVRLWDYAGNQLKEFQTYEGRVTQITFSRDGKLLTTSSATYTTRLWNLSGQQVAEFTGHQGSVRSADFSPDSKLLATANEDKTSIVWRVRGLDELLKEGCDRLKDYLITNPDAEEQKKLNVCR